MRDKPYISAENPDVSELSLRSIILAILLTVLLALSNSYLALKLGILTSASIPAAIISMGILRFFKRPSILENNAVQTAASAGEAVAGGIVYTIPALIIIGFWNHFDYWTNCLIALIGGVLGVLFSIPLRRILVHDQTLKFPEGRAIAEVLKSSTEKAGAKYILRGGLVGAFIELFQLGFKLIASDWSVWLIAKRSAFGFGAGFSATMIGAGYLIGFDMAASIFIGAILAWVIGLPVASRVFPELIDPQSAAHSVEHLWSAEMRYLGIGAMLFAGCWTLFQLIGPLTENIRLSITAYRSQKQTQQIHRTERDIPFAYLLSGILLAALLLFLLFYRIFPLEQTGLKAFAQMGLISLAMLYVLVIGFIFSVITAYFSGMVGVTASPGSSVVIAGMLFAAWLLLTFLSHLLPLPFSTAQIQAAEAITIIIGSIVTGVAAIANDNTQDLKVGQLVGATPWRQQSMLLLGVLISSLVIPPVMQLLFNVYGIAGVMPHEGMNPSQSLPAPTAALMAAVTQAVFQHSLPWGMMLCGALIIFVVIILNRWLHLQRFVHLSILGVAIGMYLPMTSSFPLFLGGLIALMANRRLSLLSLAPDKKQWQMQIGTLIACGLVAGAALLDVVLAIPFSMMHSPDALSLAPEGWGPFAFILAILTTFAVAAWMIKSVCHSND